ncbi:MAG: GNAT family N-acetyltransferase [Alsobacter sp.]
MNLRFRPLSPADLPALTDLWVDIWRDTIPSIDFEARRPWFVERMGEHRANGVDVVLAVDPAGDADILGYVTVDRRNGHIDQLGVAKAAMRRGVARALLAEARRLSPQGLHLEVNEHNPRAVRLYESEGFVPTGRGVSPRSGLPLLHYRWTPG